MRLSRARTGKALAFVALLVLADVTMGLTPLGSEVPAPWRDEAEGRLDEHRDEVERRWEGGGPAVLFADDFSDLTAQSIAEAGEGIEDYYTGALPEARDGPGMWSEDLYRWGRFATLGTSHGWGLQEGGFMRFGDPTAPQYPSGVRSELVSPIVDLRGMEPPADAQARASVSPDPFGPTPPSGIPCSDPNALPTLWCIPRENASAVLGQAAPGGNATLGAPAEAVAALRLRHAYDFLDSPQEGVADGGRVVVSGFDPATREWSDWIPLVPVDHSLRLGDSELRVRSNLTGAAVEAGAKPGTVDHSVSTSTPTLSTSTPTLSTSTPTTPTPPSASPRGQEAEAIAFDRAGGKASADGAGVQPYSAPQDRDAHLYQGAVPSSGTAGRGAWEGFRGTSSGVVESLFDLSPFAGRLLRIGFQAATAQGDAPMTPGEAGWLLDAMEVHAAKAPAVQLLGLGEPGGHAVLAPGADLRPTLVVQNTGRRPVEVTATVAVDGASHTRSFRLSVGPLGRSHVSSGTALEGLEAGLHTVDVSLLATPEASEAADAPVEMPPAAEAAFPVMAAHESAWGTGKVSFNPLVQQGSHLVERTGRLVERGQRAVIRVELENLGTTPETVHLGKSAAQPGDLRAVLVDESGVERGSMKPAAPHVTVPVSRFVSGSHGTPQATRSAAWEWSGLDMALGLHLLVKRTEGGQERTVLDGGDVLVQTVPADALDIDYRNPWLLGGCERMQEWDGQHGVVHCADGSTLASPAKRVFEIDLLRGNETGILLSYQGGPVAATLQVRPDPDPPEIPPAGAAWEDLATATFPEASKWTTQRRAAGQLPAGFAGHVRLLLSSPQPFDVDAAGAELTIRNRAGDTLSSPLVAERFDVALAPASDSVAAASPSGLVLLEGGSGPVPQDGSVRVEDRFVEDGVLAWEGTLDLRGVARPAVSFRHWIDPGFHGVGLLEVRDPAAPADDSWQAVAAFRTPTGGRTTVPAEVALWDLVGQVRQFRFRFHFDPTVAMSRYDPAVDWPFAGGMPLFPAVTSAEHGEAPVGWVIEGVNVTAWEASGRTSLHAVEPGFPGYTLSAGRFTGNQLAISDDNCWSGTTLDAGCKTRRGISALVSEPFDLRAMARPQLTVRQSASLKGTSCFGGISFPAVDVEYQFTEGDLPTGPWVPGTPTEGPLAWRRTLEVDGLPLLDPATGMLHGPPFGGNHPSTNGCNGFTPLVGPYAETDAVHAFDLSPLQLGPGQPRIQLDAWVERAKDPSTSDNPNLRTDFGSLQLHALRIADSVHVIDANVTAITSLADDRARLQALAPQATAGLGLGSDLVVVNDLVPLRVEVGNQGSAPLDLDVSLRGVHVADAADASAGAVDVIWVEETASGALLPHPGEVTGRIHLEPGQSGTVLFQASLLESPPGLYRLTARVDAANGVDTNPRNDLLEENLRLLPFRSLGLDPSAANVKPFAGDAAQARTVTAVVQNDGNVEEQAVRVVADLVRVTGLRSFEPLGLEPQALSADTVPLAARGAGRGTVTWRLAPQELVPDAEAVFRSGEKYAVRLRIDPQPDSVKTWWGALPGAPLPEATDGTGLLNVSRPQDPDCGCMLIPFIVERLLYATDLSPAGSRTLLPDVLPVATTQQIKDGWSAQTLLDGRPLADGERADIPRWGFVPAAEAGARFGEGSTGNDWLLPPYTGLERVDQVLVSPPLPAHVVAGSSRSVLTMSFGSDLQAEQAVLEVRHLVGGQWTDWQPIDDLRSHRVAIVLSHDFPRVNPTGLGSATFDLADVVLSGPGFGKLPMADRAHSSKSDGNACYVDEDNDNTRDAAEGQYPRGDGSCGTFCFGDADGDGRFDTGETVQSQCGVCHVDLDGDLAVDDGEMACGDPVLAGGPTAFCHADPDGDGVFDGGEPVYFAAACTAVAVHDVRIANPSLGAKGSKVLAGDPDVGRALLHGTQSIGFAPIGVLADMDEDGATSVGDIALAGGVAPGVPLDSTSPLGQMMVPGSLRTAFIDADGGGAYDGQDTVILSDPDLTFANQYNAGTLRNAGHPAPSWYGDPLGRSYIEPGAPGTADAAPTCRKDGRLCYWSPPMEFAVQGNEAWTAALDEAVRVLAGRFGPDNVALFSSVGQNPELAFGRTEGGTLVHYVQDGPLRLRLPIRDLDALGLELDRYGAIVLMGDGVTNGTLPEFHTQALDSIAHGPGDTILRAPSEVARVHQAKLRAILTAAPSAGITVFGTLGPAAAVLAQSGIAPDAQMSIWQTDPAMPFNLMRGNPPTRMLACAAVKPSFAQQDWDLPVPGSAHPLSACRRSDGATPGGVVDGGDAHNYGLVSPYDAQSVALQELVPNHVLLGTGVVGVHPACITAHPLLTAGSLCKRFAPRYSSSANGLQVFSAGFPDVPNVQAWAGEMAAALDANSGALPTGDWQDLPPGLSFPFGGRFQRLPDGRDRFEGFPTQVRVVVSTDEGWGGHGAFAVDRIGLLGTNRASDLGIAFVQPEAGSAYTPGRPFDVVLEATNRGLEPMPPAFATVSMEQWVRFTDAQRAECRQRGGDDCEYLVATPAPATVALPALPPGGQTQVRVAPPVHPTPFANGVFPDCEACPPPALQDNRFNLTVALVDAQDEEPLDDAQTITVTGRELVRLDEASLVDLTVRPARASYGPDTPITVEATLANLGSSRQTFRMDVAIEHARPLACEKREDPDSPSDQSLYGCVPGSTAVARALPLQAPSAAAAIERGAEQTLVVRTTPRELGVEEGVYRVSVRFSATDSAQRTVDYPPATGLALQRVVRLTDGDDAAAAQQRAPPDGHFGFEADSLDGLAQLASSPARNSWHPSGFLVSGSTNTDGSMHSGAYGPDTTTLDRSSDPNGVPLSHGWRVGMPCPGCGDSTATYIEWTRESPPSYRRGVDPPKWFQSEGMADAKGFGDFGPDYVTWLPDDTTDMITDPGAPYLSLASYDKPTLSLLTRFEATANTGFVVQMQVASRIPCTEAAPGGTVCADGGGWQWTGSWVTVTPDDHATGARTISTVEEGPSTITLPPPAGPQPAWSRWLPSNPLGGLPGFWGTASSRHVEDGGWVRVHYRITPEAQPGLAAHCLGVLNSLMPLPEVRHPDRDVCRYAHALGTGGHGQDNLPETYVARPVRFRFAAASHGSDAGASTWQIADVSLGEYRVGISGADAMSFAMRDSDERVFPIRLTNEGMAPDTVRVSWKPLRGRDLSLGEGGSIRVSLDPAANWDEAEEAVTLHMAPGQSRVAWVRLATGIIESLAPGTTWPTPFLVHTQSLVNPAVADDVLVDARFTARSWPNLEAMRLVIGGDASEGGFLASLRAPLQTTLVFRNSGELPLEGTVTARLVAVEVTETGEESLHVIDEVEVDGPIPPYREDPHDLFVDFREWIPFRTGQYRLYAELNEGVALPLPERTHADNAAQRDVFVGPVRFADLHVIDLWLAEFTGTCSGPPVQRAVAGHAYCVGARVENRGLAEALEPRIDFGIGSSSPFSAGAPSLIDLFEDRVFPAADGSGDYPSVVVTSSPRVVRAPPPSAGAWTFYAEVSGRSVMPLLENKTREVSVPVDVYRITAGRVASEVPLVPGRDTRVAINLTNEGTAGVTPVVAADALPDGLRMHLDATRQLLPGETARLDLTISSGAQIDSTVRLGSVNLTAVEDRLVRVAVPLRAAVQDEGLPAAQAMSVRAAPGPANVTLVLDARSSPLGYSWHAEPVGAALAVPAQWNASSAPFGQSVVSLPVVLAPATLPGTARIPVRLVASAGDVALPFEVEVPFAVEPRPALSAELADPVGETVGGAPATFTLRLANTGNLPLTPTVTHAADVQVTPQRQELTLRPGDATNLTFTAGGTAFGRALGASLVEWATPGGRNGTARLEWQVVATDARVEILASDLQGLRPTAGRISEVSVTLKNTGTEPFEAEVLLAADGSLQAVRTVALQPGETREVIVPYQAGKAGSPQQVTLLARPAGSDALLSDPVLYSIGDVVQADLEPVSRGGGLPIPAPPIAWLLAALALGLMLRRRRA